jgi:DNA polymerase-3 subunit delta
MSTAARPAASSPDKQLRVAIAEHRFAAAYYLHGDDDFLKEQALRDLLAAAVDPATRDFNLDVRRGGEIDAETLGSLIGTPPMMAERRVVAIRDVHALKKDARTALERCLAAPSPDVVVVLVSPAGVKTEKELAARAVTVEFAALAGDRVPKWIVHHARTQLGVEITPEAVALLQSAVGNDLPELAAELDKLASYAYGRVIDDAAVSDAVGVRRGETMGDLLDRVAARDVRGALAMVDHVLSQPKASGVTLVLALSTQVLAMAWALAEHGGRLPAFRLEQEYFSLLKAGRAFPGRPWGEAVKCWSAHGGRWTREQLDRALDALLTADQALKSTRVSTDEQVIESLILAMCAPERAEVTA